MGAGAAIGIAIAGSYLRTREKIQQELGGEISEIYGVRCSEEGIKTFSTGFCHEGELEVLLRTKNGYLGACCPEQKVKVQ